MALPFDPAAVIRTIAEQDNVPAPILESMSEPFIAQCLVTTVLVSAGDDMVAFRELEKVNDRAMQDRIQLFAASAIADHRGTKWPSLPGNGFFTGSDSFLARIYADAILAAATGHVGTYTSEGMSDGFACSCGWTTGGYWDGPHYAHQDWRTHVLSIPRKEREEIEAATLRAATIEDMCRSFVTEDKGHFTQADWTDSDTGMAPGLRDELRALMGRVLDVVPR